MYKKGDILLDKEENSEVVVVQLISTRADEYVVKERDPAENRYSDQTVYSYNSRYKYVQPADPVLKAVFVESLPTNPHELTEEGRALLAENADVKQYAFPISRVTPIDE